MRTYDFNALPLTLQPPKQGKIVEALAQKAQECANFGKF